MSFNKTVLSQDDPYVYIYEGLAFAYGHEMYSYLHEMYAQVSIDYCLHPDDDFHKIIDIMIIRMCGD